MSRRKRIVAWTAGSLGFVLVLTAVAGYLIYQHFNNNITTVDVGDAGSKGVTHDGPMNILIIGTDSRQGLGTKYGDAGSVGHADTTILLHVSADRTNATALSIPRDIVTAIPDCPTRQKDGTVKVVPGSPKHLTYPKFNESLGQDGRDPGCTMRTVRQLTGIPVDHFMMVNFEAVKTLSTAVGGVNVCLTRPLVDPKSHLNLTAGPHRIEGEQALEFVRTRHALQNQSDLDRIKLQQEFLGSMVRQVKSSGSLTNPRKLWTLADAATKALTVDSAIGSVNKLISLAQDISKVDTKHITFATLPVIDNPDEKVHATVVPDPTRAPQVLSLIRNDISLTRAKTPAKPDPRLAGPKATPHNTRVTVLNGSGVFGAAQDMVNWLQNDKGVNRSANGGNAPSPVAHTVLDYAPNQADQARSLAAMMGLPASALHQGTVNAKALQYMTLTLGADYSRPGVPISAPTALPKDVPTRQADSATCAG
jgi:LCP family protein required for cell wall assembly